MSQLTKQTIINGDKVTTGKLSKSHMSGTGCAKPRCKQLFSPTAHLNHINRHFCSHIFEQGLYVLTLGQVGVSGCFSEMSR